MPAFPSYVSELTSAITARTIWRGRDGHASMTRRSSGGGVIG